MADVYSRNKAFLKPGIAPQDLTTALTPAEEAEFRSWVQTNKVPYDLAARGPQDYDMRGFWRGLKTGDPHAKTGVNANDGKLHYTDYWKTPYHESFSRESKFAASNAPEWQGNKLVGPDGTVYFDETAASGGKSNMPDLSRVKNNVRKMADQNAPEADIDGYIASEGVTLDDVRNFKGTQPQHPEFDGSAIPGYDPKTGTMNRPAPTSDSGILAGLSSAVEGIPIAGPMLQSGVENVGAMIGSGLTGVPQQQVRQEMGSMVDSAQAANPITSAASGVGGAVAGTIPAVMAAPFMFGAGGGGLLANSLMGALSGAAIGGADAGVRSGGDPDKMLEGSLWGGGLGAAGPLAGKAIGKGVGAIAQRMGAGSSKAESALGRAAGADAIDDMGARLSAMGPDAMPMDLGPNLQRQAGALAATPGRNQEIVRSAIGERQVGAGGRVAGALDDALGQSVDTVALADDIIAKRSAAAKPLYDAAYSKPVDFTSDLESLLKRPSVGKALSKAKSLAADEGMSSRQWFANIADDGSVTIVNTPDMRQLDLTKRALDDMISTAQRGGNNNEARILTQTKNQLVGMMDKAAPEYKQARAAFSGPASVLDAMEEGSSAFKGTLTPNQLRTQMMKMGEAEKEAYTQGARAAVADIMGTARNDALAARTAFMKGYNKEKLELIVGKEQAAKLLQSLEAETAFTRTRDVVTGNSETAARLSAQADVGAGGNEPGFVRSLMNMRFGDAAADLGDKAIGGMKSAAQSKSNEELARLLTSKDPAAITRTIKLVQAAQKRGDISAKRAKEIIQGASVGAAQERKPLEITVGR